MDEIAAYNIKRWKALTEANAFVNTLIEHGFMIGHLSDQTREPRPDPSAEPGTLGRFIAVCPPWLTFRTRYRPDALGPVQS